MLLVGDVKKYELKHRKRINTSYGSQDLRLYMLYEFIVSGIIENNLFSEESK
ncbi:hypothetical protein ES708_02168 [subsurface metagenome]